MRYDREDAAQELGSTWSIEDKANDTLDIAKRMNMMKHAIRHGGIHYIFLALLLFILSFCVMFCCFALRRNLFKRCSAARSCLRVMCTSFLLRQPAFICAIITSAFLSIMYWRIMLYLFPLASFLRAFVRNRKENG